MSSISEAVALRIALAARALPDVEIRDLLYGLLHILSEPLTEAKLNKLRLGKLKQVDVLEQVEDEYLKQALAFLKGRNIQTEAEPLPQAQSYVEGEMPNSIRVACASNQGEKIDGHFGSCARFLVYQVSSDECRLIDVRTPGPVSEDDDKNVLRAALISDCQVLYTVSIGGPAAAKVVRAGLHPIKLPKGGDVPSVLDRLRSAIALNPPPWLAKAMGMDPEERIRFQVEASG